MKKQRRSFQVTPRFKKAIEELQTELRKKTGENISQINIAECLVLNRTVEDLEKEILKNDIKNLNFDIRLRFDRRLK